MSRSPVSIRNTKPSQSAIGRNATQRSISESGISDAEPYSPYEHGFDIDIPHWHGPGPAGSFVAPWRFKNFKEKYPKERIEDRVGDEAVAFFEANKGKPFFMNYWQFSVHAPFAPTQTPQDRRRDKNT
jgi:hypothetical protein